MPRAELLARLEGDVGVAPCRHEQSVASYENVRLSMTQWFQHVSSKELQHPRHSFDIRTPAEVCGCAPEAYDQCTNI